MSTDKNKIDRIVDSLDRLTIIAENRQNIADKAINKIGFATERLEEKADSIAEIIKTEAELSVKEEIKTSLINQSLNEFKQKADEFKNISEEIQSIQKKQSDNFWKIVVFAIAVPLIAFFGIILFFYLENQSLKKDNYKLNLDIAKLKKSGVIKK